MSCCDNTKTKSAASTAVATAENNGVSLGASLERLLYFNGRFLKAEDLKLEQTGYLTRIALSERAQGAGVSYGYHVTTATSATTDNFVQSVADAVFAKMQANRTEWATFLDDATEGPTPVGDEALIDRLAGALDALCGTDPGASGVTFTIAPGHAADGFGNDLLLDNPHQVKLSKLIEAFTAAPASTDAPGPVVTPKPMTSAPTLTGAFLLTIHVNAKDHGNVPVYGAQCTDAKTAACSLGYRANGVSAQLVFFDGLDGAVAVSDWWTWRGMGARAYFEKETETRPSTLTNMVVKRAWSKPAKAPETGTHVPIGMVYLRNGSFVTFDPWTSKRLRSPGELTYWLRTLRYPAQVSQVARVLQFESQLTDGLAGGASGGSKNLWELGFADDTELVLPGVGFLPMFGVATEAGVNEAAIKAKLDVYFDGVPYKLIEATDGELNALFVGALESGELRLTRDTTATMVVVGDQTRADNCLDIAVQLRTVVDLWLTSHPNDPNGAVAIAKINTIVDAFVPGAGDDERCISTMSQINDAVDHWVPTAPGAEVINRIKTLINRLEPLPIPLPTPMPTPGSTGPAQVFVWYVRDPFGGNVMFTWPVPLGNDQSSTSATALPRVCAQARLMPSRNTGEVFELLAHDGEWTSYVTSGMGSFFSLRAFRLELERPSANLAIHYAFVTTNGDLILPDAAGWLVPPQPDPATGDDGVQVLGFKAWLTGPDALNYSILYRLRLRIGNWFSLDTPTFSNGDLLTGEPANWDKIPLATFRAAFIEALRAFDPNTTEPNAEATGEAVWFSIVPRCPSEGMTVATTTSTMLPMAEMVRRMPSEAVMLRAGTPSATEYRATATPQLRWNFRWGR